jgi:prevent-host-death family protein
MQTTWQVQEAKSRLSELIGLSLAQGPQTITRHGRAVAQIVAIDRSPAAAKTTGAENDNNQVNDAFGRHLLSAPSVDVAFELPKRRSRKLPPELGG